MSLSLPNPPKQYSAIDEAQTRRALETEDRRNQKVGSDIVLQSANGKRWKLAASDLGVLSLVEL